MSKGGRGVASMTSRSKHGPQGSCRSCPKGRRWTCPAQLANYVCTEYGIVNLRGLSGYERASALISIAHPDDREWLGEEARATACSLPNSPVGMLPGEGGDRRYPTYDERRNYKLPLNSEIWGCDWDSYQSGK